MEALAQLERSHARHHEAMTALLGAARRLVRGSGGPDEVAACADGVGYLMRAVPRHFADEEETLFPRLGIRAAHTWADLKRLTQDHIKYTHLHQKLERELAGWQGVPTLAQAQRFLAEADRLASSYQAHVALEDKVLAIAATVLRPDDDAAMLAEMDARRPRGGGGGGGRRRG